MFCCHKMARIMSVARREVGRVMVTKRERQQTAKQPYQQWSLVAIILAVIHPTRRRYWIFLILIYPATINPLTMILLPHQLLLPLGLILWIWLTAHSKWKTRIYHSARPSRAESLCPVITTACDVSAIRRA